MLALPHPLQADVRTLIVAELRKLRDRRKQEVVDSGLEGAFGRNDEVVVGLVEMTNYRFTRNMSQLTAIVPTTNRPKQ